MISSLRPAFLALITGAAGWELAGWLLDFRFLPPLSRVLLALGQLILGRQILTPLLFSILGLFAGYGAAVVVGLPLGILMGRYRTLEFILSPYINAFLATPKIALVPVLYSLFGLSRWIQVAVIFLSAFLVIALSTMRGIQSADPVLPEMALAFGASNRQLLRKVLFPASLPLTMTGLRLAMGHAVRAMVTAEMLITIFGLGALIRTYGARFDAENLYAMLVVVICLALTCTWIVGLVERRFTAWIGPR